MSKDFQKFFTNKRLKKNTSLEHNNYQKLHRYLIFHSEVDLNLSCAFVCNNNGIIVQLEIQHIKLMSFFSKVWFSSSPLSLCCVVSCCVTGGANQYKLFFGSGTRITVEVSKYKKLLSMQSRQIWNYPKNQGGFVKKTTTTTKIRINT